MGMATLTAVGEVALHIGSIRNIDLFHQGIYHLRCRILEERNGQVAEGVPHLLAALAPDAEGEGLAGTDATGIAVPGLLPADVLEEEAAFRTRSVFIRYCDEEIDINDVALFRIERDATNALPLKLEVTLMFADASNCHQGLQQDTVEAGEKSPFSAGSASEPDFSAVSSQVFQLHNVMCGVHAYCPITFDELHFCQVGLMAHSTLLDFRLRIRPEAHASPHVAHGAAAWGHRTCLADDIIELADQMTHGEAASNQGGSAKGSGVEGAAARVGDVDFAEAVDRLQFECVRRLLAARSDLTQFLAETVGPKACPGRPDPLLGLAPLRLPGREAADSVPALAGLTPVPLSCRLAVTGQALAAARLLAEDLSFMSAQIVEPWQLLTRSLPRALADVTSRLYAAWDRRLAQHWAESIFCCICPAVELATPSNQHMRTETALAAAELRSSPQYQCLQAHLLEDVSMVPPPEEHPVIFEQRYTSEGALPDLVERGHFVRGAVGRPGASGSGEVLGPGAHIVVLVHGFQGTSFDMRLLKNHIALLHPLAICLCSTANEDDTERDIEQMGERLAEEVREFVNTWCAHTEEPELARLSFVAHSAGGLIVRSALPLLAEYNDRMHTFLSFSSPHLGYLYPANSLFRTGLWLAKRLRRSTCLEQLSMTDATDTSACFLARLAEMPGLEHFRYVVLVASFQDQYAPYESARIEMSPAAETDPTLGPAYAKMLRSLLDPLKPEQVIRLNVDFHIPETNLDTVIGRTAHIQFIECQTLMRMVVHTHGFLFE
mmetsp:Transcript_7818/g.24319  ORF Transcript_7818/g.24319 Transcript_7818/m.24319 type:complete len:777 (-) Transcript_7818:77-2407(-)